MSNRFTQIGFNQRVDMDWLEYVANLVLAGNDRESINTSLQELLRDKLSVGHEVQRGSREKTISVLVKIWADVPSELRHLNKRGLIFLTQLPIKEHIIIHWGMAIAVYPFLAMVATSVGRLLRLQGAATASQVQRRIREKYGERETVHRATRHALRNFINWGVLQDGSKAGTYVAGKVWNITNSEIIAWLIEAVLRGNGNDKLSLKMLLDSPVLFPFKLESIHPATLANFGQIQIIHHGLDDNFVMLK